DNLLFHGIVHVLLLGSALVYWSAVLNSAGCRLAAIGSCFFLAAECGILGFLLVFSRDPWYGEPAGTSLGLSRLADQQLGGAVMWVFGGIPYRPASPRRFVALLRGAA